MNPLVGIGIGREEAQAMQNVYGQSPKPDPHAQQIIKRLHALSERASMVRASAGATADKIVGSEPPKAIGNGVAKDTTAVGFFNQVNDLISAIDQTLDSALENLRRFENEF